MTKSTTNSVKVHRRIPQRANLNFKGFGDKKFTRKITTHR